MIDEIGRTSVDDGIGGITVDDRIGGTIVVGGIDNEEPSPTTRLPKLVPRFETIPASEF
jgi:hypothetical protein